MAIGARGRLPTSNPLYMLYRKEGVLGRVHIYRRDGTYTGQDGVTYPNWSKTTVVRPPSISRTYSLSWMISCRISFMSEL